MSALTLARHHLGQGRPERALEALRQAPQDESVDLWNVRGWSELALERFDDALTSARRGLALDPGAVGLHLLVAEAARHTGDLASAETAILEALRLDPDDPDLICSYARTIAAAGQLGKAEALLARAESIDPGSDRVRALRATLEWIRTPGGGERAARERLADDPDNVGASVQLALALLDRGETGDASRHLRRAAAAELRDEGLRELARETALQNHWALWPLRPIARYGPMPVWLGAVALLFATRAILPRGASAVVALLWVAYAVYSWVAPPLVRWRLKARRP